MPADKAAEQERRPDQVDRDEADTPDDARVPQSDLRERLERLPANHPSSPRRDDGYRLSSELDLDQYELSFPDEVPSDTDQPNQGSATEDAARVGPDGSWYWKGRHLKPEPSHLADQAVAKCRDAEGRDAEGNYGDHGLTPAMRRIEAQLDHGHLADDTESFALKDPDRYKEKLAKLISDEPDSDAADIISRINDGVRYTYIFDEEHYVTGVMEVCTALTAAGFELYERKNVWADETKIYQGVNSSWMDHDSEQIFEVQVHTPTSWQAKQESHAAYEVIESLSSTAEQRAEAVKLQERIFSEVPIPPNVGSIPSYRTEGW